MRASNVSYLIKKGISSIWKNFIMSFASFSIILVSLLQVSCALLFLVNADIIMGTIEDTNQVVIYAKAGISDEQLEHIGDVLRSNSNLTDVRYYSKEEALEDFKKDMEQYADLLQYLEENPMPETYLARVADISNIRATAAAIGGIDGVEQIKVPYEFAESLVNLRSTFTVIVGAVLLTLIIVSIVIVSNTIRTSVFARRNEITIMKYVGATNGFIKLPFFVEGCLVGVLAGTAAWGLTWFVYDSIYKLLVENRTLWEMFGFFDIIPFGNVCWLVLAANCAAGALMGTAGTLISMGKYLKA